LKIQWGFENLTVRFYSGLKTEKFQFRFSNGQTIRKPAKYMTGFQMVAYAFKNQPKYLKTGQICPVFES
jgi:hypothetical protein